MTVSQANLLDGAVIYIDERCYVVGEGGFCMNFTGLSKQNDQDYHFADKAPSFSIV